LRRSASWFQVQLHKVQPDHTAAVDSLESNTHTDLHIHLMYADTFITLTLLTTSENKQKAASAVEKVSSSHLLHDADGLSSVLRGRVQQDPVVERLQHRFHRLHAAHQTHQLRCDVTNRPHYRRNAGRSAGGAAGSSALNRPSSARRVHLLADSWERRPERDMKHQPTCRCLKQTL